MKTDLIKLEASWCEAIQCSNNTIDTPSKSFYRFPRDGKRCMEWAANTKKRELMYKTVTYLNRNCKLCSDHFEDEMFRFKHHHILNGNAVPTIFSFNNTINEQETKNNDKQATVESTLSPNQPVDASLLPVVLIKRLKLSDYHTAQMKTYEPITSKNKQLTLPNATIKSVPSQEEKCTAKISKVKEMVDLRSSASERNQPQYVTQKSCNTKTSDATTQVPTETTKLKASSPKDTDKQMMMSNAPKHVPSVTKKPNRNTKISKNKQLVSNNSSAMKHLPTILQWNNTKSKFTSLNQQMLASNATNNVPAQKHKSQHVPSVAEQRRAKSPKDTDKQMMMPYSAARHVPFAAQKRNRNTKISKNKQLVNSSSVKHLPTLIQQWNTDTKFTSLNQQMLASNATNNVPAQKRKAKVKFDTSTHKEKQCSEEKPPAMLENLNVTEVTDAILQTIDLQKSLHGIGSYQSQEMLLRRIAITACQSRPSIAEQKASTPVRLKDNSYYESFVTEEDIRRQEERVKRARHKLELALKHSDQLQLQELAIAS